MAKAATQSPIVAKKSNGIIHTKKNLTPVNTDSIEAMTPETDYMVTGTFVNIEAPGVAHPFNGIYYAGMKYFSEVLQENVTYTIPYSVARWINERFCHEKAKYLKNDKGEDVKDNNNKIFRGKFIIEQHLKQKAA